MNMLPHLASTSTPASEISRADFERNDTRDSELNVPSLDDILRNSPAAKLLGLPDKESLPDEDDDVLTPDDSEESSDASDDDDTTENDEGQGETEEEIEGEDDSSTNTDELLSEDQIDWGYKVPVTVNGKTSHLTLEEIRKGYSTDQHLSQKGRELGELKKEIEQERNSKLSELVTLGSVLHEELSASEKTLEATYVELSKQIENAKKDNDSYTARELKDKREEVQEQYWAVRNKRETRTKEIVTQIQTKQAEEQQKLLDAFSVGIKSAIPEFNDKVATSIREFALKEGISDILLESIYDPAVVKFINDYRLLKTSKEAGAVKRKVVERKAVPVKKGLSVPTQQKQAAQDMRSRAFSSEGSSQDHLNFLKSISKVSQKL